MIYGQDSLGGPKWEGEGRADERKIRKEEQRQNRKAHFLTE